MSGFEKLKRIFFGIVIFIYFAFALVMTLLLLNYNDYGVTQFGETSLIILSEKVTSDTYKQGNLVLVESVELNDIKVGEDLFVYRADSKGKVHIDFGKVGKIYTDDQAISFENGGTYSADFIAGRPTKVYESLGTYLSIIESQWGFLFIILVPCFLLFIYQVYALIVEIKYGEEYE